MAILRGRSELKLQYLQDNPLHFKDLGHRSSQSMAKTLCAEGVSLYHNRWPQGFVARVVGRILGCNAINWLSPINRGNGSAVQNTP
jgi:hypothetical protein